MLKGDKTGDWLYTKWLRRRHSLAPCHAFPKRGNAEASNDLIASCSPFLDLKHSALPFVVCKMPPQSNIFVTYKGPRLSREQKLVVRSRAMVSFRAKKLAANQSEYSLTTYGMANRVFRKAYSGGNNFGQYRVHTCSIP
jgi:hypothetical protein